ncbi:hypothetical protein LCGC14_2145230, partial [marine sediment metagenome]
GEYTGGAFDAFAAKLDSSGVRQWHTFMGSSGTDFGEAIAVDTSGNVYVAGTSYAWGSPVTGGEHAGAQDAFAAKLDNNGAYQWHTFMGSASNDYGYAIALDTGGNVYLSGYSSPNYAPWGPTPVNAHAGGYDIFTAKLNNDGEYQWHTFTGGAGNEYESNGIVLDTTGNIYVAARANQSTFGSPVNPHYLSSSSNPIVFKLNNNGEYQWHTYMGGSAHHYAYGLVIDTDGNLYVVGYSPTTWGSPEKAHAGGADAFVAKLNGSTGVRQWHTFMGGTGSDKGNGIALDTDTPVNVYVAGESTATWGSPVNTHAGNNDIFVALLNSIDGVRQGHTFMGDTTNNRGFGIAVDTSTPATVYVAGRSYDWGSPLNAYAGGEDAFVAKLVFPEINIRQDMSNISDGGTYDFGSQNTGNDYDRTFTIENTGEVNLIPSTSITITGTDAGQFSVQQQPSSPVASGGSTAFTIRFSPTSAGAKTASISITNNDWNKSPYDIDFTGTGTTGLYELTIETDSNGTTDPHPGIYGHSNGTEVDITPIADSGYIFSNWSGDASGSANPVTVTMNSDKSVTANFIAAGALAYFVVDAPANGTAGTAFSLTVTAKDSLGNTTIAVSGITTLSVDSGTISQTSIDASGFTDDGIWTGPNITLSEAGSRTI